MAGVEPAVVGVAEAVEGADVDHASRDGQASRKACKCHACDWELDDEPCISVDELSISRRRSWLVRVRERTPGFKLLLAILVGLALSIPLFSVWLLVYDRQTPVRAGDAVDHRRLGRAAGDGRAGAGHSLSRDRDRDRGRERPERDPQPRRDARAEPRARDRSSSRPTSARSCASARSTKRWSMTRRSAARRDFAFPPDLARTGVELAQMDLEPRRTALRPQRSARARRQPARRRSTASRCGCSRAAAAAAGAASSPGSTPASLDRAGRWRSTSPIDFRGNAALSLAPQAGDTRWRVRSAWPQPELRRRLPARRTRRSTARGSTPPTASAISRSAARWFRPAIAAASNMIERVPPPSRMPTMATTDAAGHRRPGADGADQPDPAGRSSIRRSTARPNTASCSSASPSSRC